MSGAHLDRAVGRILGDRYQLVSLVGSGASAEVYQATDLRLGRSVAVKQLRSTLTDDARFAKLFRSEAHLAAKLSHPNILTVFDWSADTDGVDGGAYIVTELLSGGTLRSVLDREGTISLSQVAYIGLQGARGLAAAHDSGLVHRDIKPANLLFGADGRIHIGDFGIARAVAQAAWTEPEGVLIGTARYAAPEQATTGRVDGMADVYSLTICLLEAATGEVPLVQDNAIGTMTIRQAEDLPVRVDPGRFGPLTEVLAWGGLADPNERATAAEFRNALIDVCRTLPDPDPLILIDLTEHTGGPAAIGRTIGKPNVRIGHDGELVIEGDDSDLALPAQSGEDRASGGRHDPTSDGFDGAAGRSDWLADDSLVYDDTPGYGGLGGDGNGGDNPGLDRESDVVGPPAKRLRWLVGLAAFLLLLVGAFLVGRILAQSQSGDVETISVGLPAFPVVDYTDLSRSDVEAEAEANGWTVTTSEQFMDGTEPGQLLSQTPEPGAQMGPGGVVELVYSLGPELRAVPEMVGLTEDEVRAALEGVNLSIGSVDEQPNEEFAVGVVLEATIDGVPAQPGAEFETGTMVDLVVSSGPAPREVPDLVGLTVEQARLAVETIGLELGTAEQFSESVGEGLIISADPAVGSSIDRGSTVTVSVSLGRPFVTIPDIVGLPVSEAIEVLRTEGFTVVINGQVGETVIATRPGVGESIRSGSEIEVISDS